LEGRAARFVGPTPGVIRCALAHVFRRELTGQWLGTASHGSAARAYQLTPLPARR
jgi:DNA polymerase III delta prime subunit